MPPHLLLLDLLICGLHRRRQAVVLQQQLLCHVQHLALRRREAGAPAVILQQQLLCHVQHLARHKRARRHAACEQRRAYQKQPCQGKRCTAAGGPLLAAALVQLRSSWAWLTTAHHVG